MKKLREYVFYRVYERTLKNTHNMDEAVNNATYVVDIYDIVFVEALFFILKGIIGFDMVPVTLFYLTYKKSIILGRIMAGDILVRQEVINGLIDNIEKTMIEKRKENVSNNILLFANVICHKTLCRF